MTSVSIALIIAGGILILVGIITGVLYLIAVNTMISSAKKWNANATVGFTILLWMWPAILGGVLLFFGLT